ncbi:MAG: hypothetical protein ACHQ4G_00220 [Opitutales bacterium]
MPDPALFIRPKPLGRTTTLGDPAAAPLVIHPAGDGAWGQLAARVARALAARGVTAECTTDLALLPERSTRLAAACRRRPIIALGSLINNRVLQPHYANFLCATDAAYPGDAGWELRTLVDPWHTGANLILVGGSQPAPVGRAIAALVAAIAAAPAGVTLPWLLQLELDPAVKSRFAAWPHTPLTDAARQVSTARGHYFRSAVVTAIGSYTPMWWLTGDPRYADFAVQNLRALNDYVGDSYGDWHYLAERFLRTLPLLESGGWLTEADRARTCDLLLGTALGSENDWWRMRDAGPPLGHRHQGKGTFEFLMLTRYLRDHAEPSPALRQRCDRWIGECQAFLDSLLRAGIDDQDDESTFNNIAQLYRYALGEERHEFFTTGQARRIAERAVALHDNMGCGSGQGGYGEGHNMYFQHEATVQVACSAFYCGARELKWILHHLPRLAEPQRIPPFHFHPGFVHQFETGAALVPQAPRRLCGLSVLPALSHQFTLGTHPTRHVEPRGHMANAPETWLPPEGIGLTRLIPGQIFDKVVIRSGFASTDAYLLLQGCQAGFRWQGHMIAANCIVRFAQAGHIWLVQNTVRHAPYDKNGLQLSDGTHLTPLPPLAEMVAAAEFAPAGLSVTRLPDAAQTDWTRHLFWSREGEGWFVVIDRVTHQTAGPRSLTCTWRTPGWAGLEGRHWHSDQGRHRFTLVAGDDVAADCEEETNQGASRPFVLRQRRHGHFEAGEVTTFQNLFYVRPQDSVETLDLQQLDAHSAVVRRNGRAVAWCGAALTPAVAWLPQATAQAASVWASASSLALAGATALDLPGLVFRSAAPVALWLDLAVGALHIEGGDRIGVTLTINGTVLTGSSPFALPAEWVAAVSGALGHWLACLGATPARPAALAARENANTVGRSLWTQPVGPGVFERLRQVCVTADPAPTDGFAFQLIDTILPQSREVSELWPAAPHYEITLRFPEPQAVAALHLLGDCRNEPVMRTFSPLPEGIRVEAETADGQRHACALEPAPDRLYKRLYIDSPLFLEQQTAPVDRTVRALHMHCPTPADGRPFVLNELEVLGTKRVPPRVKHWLAADLDADGAAEIVIADSAGHLRVLDSQGRTRWEHHLGIEATHLSVQPAGPAGAPTVCIGLIDGTLHVFAANGATVFCSPVGASAHLFKDLMLGMLHVVNCLAVWRHDETGRGWLVAGGYGLMYFLDGTGKILGHSWADGAWVTGILRLPDGHPDAGALYCRSGWNHGIGHYAAFPGPEPSGAAISLGGARQSMFRELTQVIPFVNGPALEFAHVPQTGQPAGAIFAAGELGFGLLSLATHEWIWQHEIAGRLQAAGIATVAGEPAALVGGADGFVTAYRLSDGRLLRRHLAGAPVVAIGSAAGGGVLVGTRAGLQRLDAAWSPHPVLRRPVERVLPFGERHALVCHSDHTLEFLEHTPE